MKLTSLKQNYNDTDKDKPADATSGDYYPSLYFNEDQIEALGLKGLSGGDKLTMTATVTISSKTENKEGECSVTLDILEAGFEAKEKKPETSSILFPNEKKS